MRPVRKVSRRSFLATVTGAAAATGSGIVAGDAALAFIQGCSDSDPTDPGGRGRRCQSLPQTGCSDSDPTDPIGRGQRCTSQTYSGCSDSDPTDPGGRGRNCQGQAYTGCSDSDPTDPGGRGRSCGNANPDEELERELAGGAWQWSGLPAMTRVPRAVFRRSLRGGGSLTMQDGVYTYTGSWEVSRGRLSITLVGQDGLVYFMTLTRNRPGWWSGAMAQAAPGTIGQPNYAGAPVSLSRM